MFEIMVVIFVIVLYVPMLFRACFFKSSHEIVAEQRSAGQARRAAMTVITIVLLCVLQWLCFKGELSLMAIVLYAIILYELVVGAITLARPAMVFAVAESNTSIVKVPLFAELAFFCMLVLCHFMPMSFSFASDDTWVRFTVGGEEYELGNATFYCEPIGGGDNHLVELRPDLFKTGVNDFPNGSIQWQMDLEDRAQVFDREIDLTTQARNVNVYFALDSDRSVIPEQYPPRTKIEITELGEDYVEGSFESAAMTLSSETSTKLDRVVVSGTFRARLTR